MIEFAGTKVKDVPVYLYTFSRFQVFLKRIGVTGQNVVKPVNVHMASLHQFLSKYFRQSYLPAVSCVSCRFSYQLSFCLPVL